MTEYLCNACGFEFSEEEAHVNEHNAKVIMCPLCGAERWDGDDDSVIVKLNGDNNEEE